MLRQNLQAFLLGGVTALGFGYVRLHQDVWEAASLVDGRLESVGSEAVSTATKLQKRVGALEAEVAKLKGAIAEVAAKKE